MSAKDEWYENRILWKIEKSKLLTKSCVIFDDLEPACKNIINDCEILGSTIVVFWNAANLWTVLSSQEIISKIDNSLNRILLDDIEKEIKFSELENFSGQEIKREAEFLSVGKRGVIIWAPSGSEIFALMNILKMFPLNV